MAPTPIKRLIALQKSRYDEMNLTSERLKEKERSAFNINIVNSRVEALTQVWNNARDTHEEIVARDESTEIPYISENLFANLQKLYEETLDFLLTLRSELEPPVQTETVFNRSLNDSSFADFELRAAKLPKLDLPTFSGRYEDWENFCDLFTTLVHNAPKLADATKLQYLKSCLKGSAADLVKNVATTNANYATTWQSLKARFHNPRLIVFNHLRALMNMPHLKKESAAELRSFADEAQRIVRALKNLKMPVEHWDIWFVFILSARLDTESRKAWETNLSTKDNIGSVSSDPNLATENPLSRFPRFSDLADFLENRARTLGMIASEEKDKKAVASNKPGQIARKSFHAATSHDTSDGRSKCPCCGGLHRIFKCFKFRLKNPTDRRAEVRRLNLCFNCFGDHKAADCSSNFRCKQCSEKHHTMLHTSAVENHGTKPIALSSKAKVEESKIGESTIAKASGSTTSANVHTSCLAVPKRFVILATAQVIVEGVNGARTRVRALLDQGSEVSFVSSKIVKLLNLSTRRTNVMLNGLGNSSAGVARRSTQLTLFSTTDQTFKLAVDALVLPTLTSQLPARRTLDLNCGLFDDISLADPSFYIPDTIDMILGADVYGQLLKSGLRHFHDTSLIAQETKLGWVLSGPVNEAVSGRTDAFRRAEFPPHSLRVLHCASNVPLDTTLQRFWDLEEIPRKGKELTPEQELCENQFSSTHFRDSEGRFVVQLPLRSELPKVASETRRMACQSLATLHRRFDRDPKLAAAYIDFMDTYEKLGHMKRVPDSDLDNTSAWYLPHHGVVQSSQYKWKLRVVFDASRQTSGRHCLNDFLMPGPALQRDLSLILLNWRRFRYVFTADIVKMFRQMRVTDEHQDFQRIVWAPTAAERPKDYKLTTVTYGTACAPYLAIRTLIQLATDKRDQFPLGSDCLVSNTYVDDIFAGEDNISAALGIRRELVDLLQTAGIELDKWAANDNELLPCQAQHEQMIEKTLSSNELVKTLGLQWKPSLDEFVFSSEPLAESTGVATKRLILSKISKLFDPLGWIAPVTVTAKILMQDLWLSKCDWDSPVPIEIRHKWIDYCRSLVSLSSLSIPRWLGTYKNSNLQIHGFADASRRAYAAVVYLRIEEGDDRFRVMLLTAKSKVAPVKTVSIPNLELCGAALLVKLIQHVQGLDFLKHVPVFAWSDSQIVLTWLKKHPCHWKTFVANRVSLIQTELPSAIWTHVPTKENPADLATRGCTPADLSTITLWWEGPKWLAKGNENWPKEPLNLHVNHARVDLPEPSLLTRYSSLTRLIRIVATCLRLVRRWRSRRDGTAQLPSFLTTEELLNARHVIFKIAQHHAFAAEIKILREGKFVAKGSRISNLNPFIDDKSGLLRVGGRLSNSALPYSRMHPPILPRESALSRLLVDFAHRSCLHGGPTLTSATVIKLAWILGRNRLVKTTCRTCIICQRVKPRLAHQMMGDLPAPRVSATRPFSVSGLDYAGPFQIRTSKGRGVKAYKGYIVLFVCFVTRAIHLEAVSDLTAQSFLAAYKRFTGRRGLCQQLYSDNATTFHAADKQLQAMFCDASKFYHTVAESLSNDGTKWTFIPPCSPHYGGLWESGVKSVKFHLKRAIGDKSLVFEEFTTVLVEIEACLNSRPLRPLSSDLDDLSALTPAHFLLGEPSGVIPDADSTEIPENRLDRYHQLQNIRNSFWKRWSIEYLQYLQDRSKWRTPTDNFAVGQLVLVRDDRYPPAKWPLGRVIEVHVGPDGLVRVVTIRTATSTLRRHIARVCPLSLPISEKSLPSRSADLFSCSSEG